jgi:hypothetical protein
MIGWIVPILLYVFAWVVFVRVLGGFGSAGEAFRRWGHASALRRTSRVSPSSS